MSEQTIPFVLERCARDGCDCRPWMLRCVHFGGVRVGLMDRTDMHDGGLYAVGQWTGDNTLSDWFRFYESMEEADAALDAAELRLLQGGDA